MKKSIVIRASCETPADDTEVVPPLLKRGRFLEGRAPSRPLWKGFCKRLISLVAIGLIVACAWVRAEDIGAGKTSAGANWNVALKTEAAELHGGQMKEEKGGRSNIGGWDNAADWVSWKVKFPEIGSFKASAQIATMDGSEIVLEVGGQQISARVPRTGGWGNFVAVDIGRIEIKEATEHVVKVRPKDAQTWKPINLSIVTLEPVDSRPGAQKPSVVSPTVTPKQNHAVTPASRNGEKWWSDRHAEKIAEMSKRDIELLMIGDSITAGFETNGPGAKVWKQYFEPRKAINLGFGGDRTQHVLWRFGNMPVLKKAPKGAVLLIGTNNIGWGSDTPGQAAEGIQAVVLKLKELYPETKILVLAVFPRRNEPDHRFRKQINEINAGLPDLLKDMKNVTLLDIGPNFLDEKGFLLKGVMPDTTHPSENGYEIWAKATEPELKKLLGE